VQRFLAHLLINREHQQQKSDRCRTPFSHQKLVPVKSPALIHEASAMVTNFFFFAILALF
jgi:hypothetical protein